LHWTAFQTFLVTKITRKSSQLTSNSNVSCLVGAGLFLSGKVPEGTVTAAGGMAASLRCLQLAKDANDRLDKIFPELKDED
jgi:hypothetical protein